MARRVSDRYRWLLPVEPAAVINILQDVEALPTLTKPYLPAWAIIDIETVVTRRDADGLPAEVRTTTSAFGVRDRMTSHYHWTDSGCRWRITSSRLLKSAGCDLAVEPAVAGSRLTVDTWAEFRALLTPSPVLRRLEKLQRIGFENLHEIITEEAHRRTVDDESSSQ